MILAFCGEGRGSGWRSLLPARASWLFLVLLGGGRRGAPAESLGELCLLKLGTEEGEGAEDATVCVIGRTVRVILMTRGLTEYFVCATFCPECFCNLGSAVGCLPGGRLPPYSC